MFVEGAVSFSAISIRSTEMNIGRTDAPAEVVSIALHDRDLSLDTAADVTNKDCMRAMHLAHKLARELRGAEERAREAEDRVRQLEAEATHFRSRAARAEDWLKHIQKEVEQILDKRNVALDRVQNSFAKSVSRFQG
jgi:hypothetical protein